MIKLKQIFPVLALCASLAACGTDTSPGTWDDASIGPRTPGVTITASDGSPTSDSGFSLRLTDAPIDGLVRAVVQFTAVEMKLESGSWIKYTLPAPKPVDLLALQGLATANLLVNMPIKPGRYNQVRFIVDETPMANFVEKKGGGVFNLEVPGGSTAGLKIRQRFSIPRNRLVNFTVDFDLRKSIRFRRDLGVYRLRPRMRLVVDRDVGFIRGSVNPALLLAPGCSDADVDSHNSVYVYSGHNVKPQDINQLANTRVDPITTTIIRYDSSSGLYIYEAAFLPQDNYTVAFTCSADLDDLEADDNLPFFHIQNVTVLVTDTTFLKP